MQLSFRQQDYRQTLLDFRASMFQRLSTIMAVFAALAAYVVLFFKPLPYILFFSAFAFSFFALFIQHMAKRYPNAARYTFVLSLYLAVLIAMLLFPVPWMVFLIFPVILVGALLMSNTMLWGGLIFLLITALFDFFQLGDYPLDALSFLLALMMAVVHTTISTFNTALQWYSSMHNRADTLLEETRERRAELIQTLKSLQNAYDSQHRLQQALVYARQQAEEARRAKELFASNISHELRTPLNLIMGFSQIMVHNPEVYGAKVFSPTFQRDIYQIYNSSRHLIEMIDDVLDLSHIEVSQFAMKFERCDMNNFLADTVGIVSNLFRDETLRFITDIPPHLPELSIDRTRIRQVIINLITNARRFTKTGSVLFRVWQERDKLEFAIIDTGIGIAPEEQEAIFSEFYQVDYSLSRSHGGAGLGLPIAKRFVEAHGGTIRLESEPGKGTSLFFSLPLPAQQKQILHPSILAHLEQIPPSILIADPDTNLARLMGRFFPDNAVIHQRSLEGLEKKLKETDAALLLINQEESMLSKTLENSPVPILAVSIPSPAWLLTQLRVDACEIKPIHPERIREILEQYPQAKRLMIVDDEMGFVQLLQRMIEITGGDYQLQRAYDGEQALALLQESPCDLLFLDLEMPEADGYHLIEAIHADKDLPDFPMIILTGTPYTQMETQKQSRFEISLPDAPLNSIHAIAEISKVLLSLGHQQNFERA